MDIIFIIILIIVLILFIIIFIDFMRYVVNEFNYMNQKINFDEYYYNWGMWSGYTLLGNLITLVEKIYNKIKE